MHPYYHPHFLHFIVYFNDNQDYFECHEVLEEYWKEQKDFSKQHPLTGYILMATGLYHWRRGNVTGAAKTMRNALQRFQQMPATYSEYKDEVAIDEVIEQLRNALERLESGQDFSAFTLRISPALQLAVNQTKPAELLPKNSDAVIHKHMLRDRSDILLQREEKKKGSR
ncbi:DUF309 domain-containing protein [Sporosarcina sp. PTS2304]|uniref:DUF309 domain-containing protein n=1 Tax=Sporosarcina sp. PTS2304 TaxID=2283194 RepID=UPI000E0CD63A|nr:DUF309 domain-containing protein [Sporosarcina sp. PTS2304]AXH98829.1 DUF309 domain-containing protein [Sporosarcina sp. PTS2304]